MRPSRALLTLAVTVALNHGIVLAQSVRGTVVDRTTKAGIAAAAIEVTGFGRTVTSPEGTFIFLRIPSGRYEISVQALGYQPVRRSVELPRDSLLRFELDAAPLQVDSLMVSTKLISVHGIVLERATGRELTDADAVTDNGLVGFTNAAGRFTFKRFPANSATRISVRAFGYLPSEAVVDAERDTTLRFSLEVDPLVNHMITAANSRLETRSRFTPFARRQFDRDELLRKRMSTPYEILRDRLGARLSTVRCVLIDEVERGTGLEELKFYLPESIERMEVLISRDAGIMVRVYTREYIQRLIQRSDPLGRIILNPGMCR